MLHPGRFVFLHKPSCLENVVEAVPIVLMSPPDELDKEEKKRDFVSEIYVR